MVRVYDERVHAEEMLEKGFLLQNKVFVELMILCKYFKETELKDEEIEEKLHTFSNKWLKTKYNYVKFIPLVKKVITSVKKYKLRTTNAIIFTQKEVDSILTAPNPKQQRLLFIYMFLAKMNNNKYVNCKEAQVFKEAHISNRIQDRVQITRDLYLLGLIHPTMTGGIQVLCLDENQPDSLIVKVPPSPILNEEYPIIMEEFKDPIVYWFRYLGAVTRFCDNCGALFKITNNRQTRCKDCQTYNTLEKKKDWAKKSRASLKEETIINI